MRFRNLLNLDQDARRQTRQFRLIPRFHPLVTRRDENPSIAVTSPIARPFEHQLRPVSRFDQKSGLFARHPFVIRLVDLEKSQQAEQDGFHDALLARGLRSQRKQ